jgi:polyphosphate kinase
MAIQLQDNVKARLLDKELSNNYVKTDEQSKVRSQIEIYNYLQKKTLHLEDDVLEQHAATTLT